MNRRTWMLLAYVAIVPACGSNEATPIDASDVALAAGDDGGKDSASGTVVYLDANLPDAAVEASILDGPTIEVSVLDGGECRADKSELSTKGWILPCVSQVDAGVASPTCNGQVPGLLLFRTTCDQRETWLWNYGGTHSQACFYDHGALVGTRLQNDTPSFCGNVSHTLSIGATEGCPGTPATLVLNCNPSN